MGATRAQKELYFTKLKELRIFNMRDSLQPIIWETLFRIGNEGGTMRVLDLRMNHAPLIRVEGWIKADWVRGLDVAILPLEVLKSRGI